MITFIPYEPEHLAQIKVQPAQELWRDCLILDGFAESLANGMSWTGLVAGVPVGCAGFTPHWEGRVTAWALFGVVPKMAWPAIVKKIRREFRSSLQSHGRHRVEITVPAGFGPGCRLALMLGFAVEGKMRAYGPDGSDHLLYAQILPGDMACA